MTPTDIRDARFVLLLRDPAVSDPPWFNWVIIHVESNEVIGYFRHRRDAEKQMRYLAGKP